MRPDVCLRDAKRVFSEVLSAMMVEEGFDYDRYTVEEIRYMVRSCVDEAFVPCWDEFMGWVEHGDPRRAETVALLRANVRGIPRGGRVW